MNKNSIEYEGDFSRRSGKWLLLLLLLGNLLSCSPSSSGLDPESLPRSSFSWNAAELEVGLAHFDTVFPGRDIPASANKKELLTGPPIAGFGSAGTFEGKFERFMIEQKVAGVIVLHKGVIRLEEYGLNHGPEGRWTSQSVAKSLTSTLVGIAVEEGFISSIDDAVTSYIPNLTGSAYDNVSIRHLMTMTSGVRWIENYTDPTSDIALFYTAPVQPGLDATVSYMRNLPAETEPGASWVYKTGETHLLGVLVSSATGMSLADYLSSRLWGPYGMENSASWSIDRSGHELAGCCFQASLRDFARYGQFVLGGGKIDGRVIVPDWWFEQATTTQIPLGTSGAGYGYQWWTSMDKTFRAIGIHGQLIYIDPVRKLVIAMNSAWPEAVNQQRTAAQSEFLTTIILEIDKE